MMLYEVFIKSELGLDALSVFGTEMKVENNIVKILHGKQEVFVSLLHPGIFVKLAEQSVRVVKDRKKVI